MCVGSAVRGKQIYTHMKQGMHVGSWMKEGREEEKMANFGKLPTYPLMLVLSSTGTAAWGLWQGATRASSLIHTNQMLVLILSFLVVMF